MQPRTPSRRSAEQLVQRAVRGELGAADLAALCQDSPELVSLALLAAARRIAQQNTRIADLEQKTGTATPCPSTPSLSTPSGMVPIYTKANTPKKGRRKKAGARAGHPGARRESPVTIDEHQTHRLKRCPHCAGQLQRCARSRTRVIEDIPDEIEPVVTEHTIHRDYCPHCKKHVEPVVPDALPRAALGHHVIALASWFHYGLGLTLDQVVDILSYHLQTQLTPGGLIDAWRRLAEILTPWYEQIAEQAKASSHLHADETGWRVGGATWWLWCFTNARNCYYMIDRSRGSPALQKFFVDCFEGVLITDFWRAYDGVCAPWRQFCLVHLLRELVAVDERNGSVEWRAFSKTLRRLIRDAIRLRKRADFTTQRYGSRILRIDQRLCALVDTDHRDADARRLAKRLGRTRDHLWTFLEDPEVSFDNNFAERQIRPAVLLRKNGQNNRSVDGAAVQSVLMSVYRTLRLRGHDPIQTLAKALRTYTATGKLPDLPV